MHPVDQARKRALLVHLLKSGDWSRVLVFARNRHRAHRLAGQLRKEGIDADAIHGGTPRAVRARALEGFQAGALRVLVATDPAARGLTLEAPRAVSFDLPQAAEDYARRAAAAPESLLLACAEDEPLLAALEQQLGRTLERREVPGFEPGEAAQPVPAAPPQQPPRQAQAQQQQPRRPEGRHQQRRGRNRPQRQPGQARANPSKRGRGPRSDRFQPYDSEEREAQIREARAMLEREES